MTCNKAEQGQSEKEKSFSWKWYRRGSSSVKGGNSPHPSFLHKEEFLSRWDFLLHINSEMHPNSYTITTSFPIKAKKTLCSLTDCCKQTECHSLCKPKSQLTSVCVQLNMHCAWPLYTAGRDPSPTHLVLATKKPMTATLQSSGSQAPRCTAASRQVSHPPAFKKLVGDTLQHRPTDHQYCTVILSGFHQWQPTGIPGYLPDGLSSLVTSQ